MVTSTAISINQVSKKFGHGENQVIALNDVSVDIQENEFFTLLGPSGCGKTTLLRLIAGFEHPSMGNIQLRGEEISHLPPFKRPVNTVFQNYALFPHMTVSENIGFGLEMQDKPADEVKSTVTKMLKLVQMEALADRRTDQISGGQQQRVALARALAPHPKLLLLDEPLSALDYKLRKSMQIELKRLQHETGITFIFVTHDQEEALTMSDRIAVMSEGKILQIGSPEEIYNRPAERFVADFIGDTNFLEAEIVNIDNGNSLLKLSSGKTVQSGQTQSAVGSSVTIAIRPEQAHLNDDRENSLLGGFITNVVYSGTDTHYHLELHSEEAFIVRTQNKKAEQQHWQIGQEVGIVVEPASVQILRD